MELFRQDLRYGGWLLLKNRAFTLVAIVTLALGIGANTTIFSLLNFILLRPLNYSNPDQLVMIWERNLKKGWSESPISFANFADYKVAKSLDIAAFAESNFNLTGGEEPERVTGSRVSAGLFSLLGVKPFQGRIFLPRDDLAGADRVLILSYGLWQRSFGANQNLIGQSVQLNGQSYIVVGVMPSDFRFPPAFSSQTSLAEGSRPEIFVPYLQQPSPNLTLAVRTASDPKLLTAALRDEIWTIDKDIPVSRMNLMKELISNSVAQPRLYAVVLSLFAAMALMLAAIGVYGVISYSVSLRARDIAIRMALGAGPRNVFGMVIGQALLLTLLGLAVGLVVSLAATRVMSSLLYGVKTTDPLTLVVTSITLLLMALLASFIPALRATKIDPIVTLGSE